MRGNLCVGLATVNVFDYWLQLWFLRDWAKAIAKRLGLKVINHAICSYGNKYGREAYTVVLFLAESHLAIESWPEQNRVEITVCSCKPFTKKKFNKALGIEKQDLLLSKVFKKTKNNSWR